MLFNSPGKNNTEEVVNIVLKTAKERSISHIVVASVTGETAMLFQHFEGQVVCVTHADGFFENGKNELSAEMKAQLEQKSIKVLTTSHILSGVERGVSIMFHGIYPAEIIAHSLRMFGQGTKVCVEVAMMALESGLVPFGQKVIAVGGTMSGADSAAIITPAYAKDVFRTKVHEILCKPEL